jgi:hypothetical protein
MTLSVSLSFIIFMGADVIGVGVAGDAFSELDKLI